MRRVRLEGPALLGALREGKTVLAELGTAVFVRGVPLYTAILRARRGEVVAYLNACPHQDTPLDAGLEDDPDSRTPDGVRLAPFTDDGALLICVRHGATFRPDDGVCTAGPCPGERLLPLEARFEGESVVLELP